MVTMQVLPNREDWLKHRTKIGGSDASAILGKNPYKTNVELWKDKAFHLMPEDISDKPYVKYGIQAEPHLRALFSLDFPEKKVFYEENNMWTNDKYPFAHASLDGWFEDPLIFLIPHREETGKIITYLKIIMFKCCIT